MDTAKEDEDVRAALVSVIEAEERVKLIKAALKAKVGFSEIEYFNLKQAQHCKGGNDKSDRIRNENLIKTTMQFKLHDAVADLKNLRKISYDARKGFIQRRGPDARKIIRQFEAEGRKIRTELKAKNEQKVKHLVSKFKSKHTADCENIPDKINRYSQAKIFQGGDEEEPVNDSQAPIIYGDLRLDKDEIAALLLDPKFATLDSLVIEDFDLEVECTLTKMKWNRMSDTGNCEDEKEREELELEDAESREVYDSINKTYNAQKQRVTDLEQNAFVILPKPQPVDYEALLEIRRQKYTETFVEYKENHCDKEGKQRSNLTKQQASGIRKLKKRISEGEIIVCETDKAGRLCVMPVEMYMEAGLTHTDKDEEVDEEFVQQCQRKLNGHVSMWIKMLSQGENWEHEDRLRETQINHSCSVAPLYLLVKSHKKYSGVRPGGEGPPPPPPTRPVCGAVNGMDVHLSNILSPIVEAVANEMKDKAEVISTDDALSVIDQYNDKQIKSLKCADEFEPNESIHATNEYIFTDVLDELLGEHWQKETRKEPEYSTDEDEFATDEEDLDQVYNDSKRQTDEVVICAGDVISLFPRISHSLAGKCLYQAILETEINFEGLNYEEICLYIALNHTASSVPVNIRKLVPIRKYAKGKRPGITSTAALSGGRTVASGQWRFTRSPDTFTAEEKKLLFAEAVRLGVVALFGLHLYSFGSKVFVQRSGTPIGVRLSCGVARLVANSFDKELKVLLDNNKIKVDAIFRYLDDHRNILRALAPGWRWNKGKKKLQFRKKWVEEDMEISPVERTSRVLNDIMNGVYEDLQWEYEHQEMFPDNTLPTLDVRLFVQDSLVLYSFYSKDVANKHVIHKDSALDENMKIASLTQNLIRRMKNTSELVNMKVRLAIVDEFAEQLMMSGYGRDQTRRIITGGLVGYENLKATAAESGEGLHRSAAAGAVARRRARLLGRGNWFRTPPKNTTRDTAPPNPRHKKHPGLKKEKKKLPVSVLFSVQTRNGIFE